jgi:hypothetical protein
VKGWEKDILCRWKPKRAQVVIFTYDKLAFTSQIVKRVKESHYIMTKESIHPKGTTIINICVPNITAPRYRKQILIDLKRDRLQCKNSRQLQYNVFSNGVIIQTKNQLGNIGLNHTLDQMDLRDRHIQNIPSKQQQTTPFSQVCVGWYLGCFVY